MDDQMISTVHGRLTRDEAARDEKFVNSRLMRVNSLLLASELLSVNLRVIRCLSFVNIMEMKYKHVACAAVEGREA